MVNRKPLAVSVQQLTEFFRQVERGEINRRNLQFFLSSQKKTAQDLANAATRANPGGAYLRLSAESLIIPATDGSRTIADAADTFPGWIDPNFHNWGVDIPGQATKETPVMIYEMVEDATFAGMFRPLAVDVSLLCLTQSQIIEFCRNYPNHLGSYTTFFPFRSYGELLVAYAFFHVDGRLEVHVRRRYDTGIWHAVRRHRVVVPQLA